MNTMLSSMTSSKTESSCDTESPKFETVQLEALAETLQEQLFKRGLVQDHQHQSKTVQSAFYGQDIVTVLVDVLPAGVSREQALQVGRDIEEEFQFFSHSKNTSKTKHILQDTATDEYQFQNNLPVQVHKVRKEYPSFWDKVRAVECRIQLKSHRGLIKVHSKCFVARELVDELMRLKLVQSRREGVILVRKMNEKVQFFRPVDGTVVNFKYRDDDRLCRFMAAEDRLPEPNRSRSPRSPRRKTSASKSLRRSKSLDVEVPTGSDGGTVSNRKPVRRVQSMDSEAESHASVPKDTAYFKDRALGIRSRLDVYREERAITNAAKASAAAAAKSA